MDAQARFDPPAPVHLRAVLGRSGPNGWDSPTQCWRAWVTPDGPASLCLRLDGPEVEATAWGPGATRAVEATPSLLGFHDDPDAFEPDRGPHGTLIRGLAAKTACLRVGGTTDPFPAAVAAVLGQRVTTKEAAKAWRTMCWKWGGRAPGPRTLALPPTPEALADLPYWALHHLGVDARRSARILALANHPEPVLRTSAMTPAEARAHLTKLPGLGEWSAAHVTAEAFGDADAVPVGDFHLKHMVVWHLTGRPRGTDEQMLDLLAPWAGHRARVVRLLIRHGGPAPRFGPGIRLVDVANL